MLRDKFREFSRDTSSIGQERVDGVNGLADALIAAGHSENATVAEWKDGLNEAWADLLELIDTRSQMLAASYELHRFYHDARETLAQVQHKQKQLPDEVGRDLNTAEAMQRMHTTYEHDIQALSAQVSPWHDTAQRVTTWHGVSRHGTTWHGSARPHLLSPRCARCRRTRRGWRRRTPGRRRPTSGGTSGR